MALEGGPCLISAMKLTALGSLVGWWTTQGLQGVLLQGMGKARCCSHPLKVLIQVGQSPTA